MLRYSSAVLAVLALDACVSHVPSLPSNATVGNAATPVEPQRAASAAAPRIQAMAFSTLTLRRGSHWSGSIVAPTNTASVEVRTNLFSIDVPRTAFGRFAFDADVLDLPPIFVRHYRLRVIARNSAGAQAEEDVPFEIR